MLVSFTYAQKKISFMPFGGEGQICSFIVLETTSCLLEGIWDFPSGFTSRTRLIRTQFKIGSKSLPNPYLFICGEESTFSCSSWSHPVTDNSYLPISIILCLMLCWRLCQNSQAFNSSSKLFSSLNTTTIND